MRIGLAKPLAVIGHVLRGRGRQVLRQDTYIDIALFPRTQRGIANKHDGNYLTRREVPNKAMHERDVG